MGSSTEYKIIPNLIIGYDQVFSSFLQMRQKLNLWPSLFSSLSTILGLLKRVGRLEDQGLFQDSLKQSRTRAVVDCWESIVFICSDSQVLKHSTLRKKNIIPELECSEALENVPKTIECLSLMWILGYQGSEAYLETIWPSQGPNTYQLAQQTNNKSNKIYNWSCWRQEN